jgi:phage tail-like protein
MTKLLDLLPKRWRLSSTMRNVAKAVGKPLDTWRMIAGSIHIYLSPRSAPAEWLPWLMHAVAIPEVPDTLTELQKRALIESAFDAWTNKGTTPGIEAYLKAVAGINAQVVRTNNSLFIAGVSKAGDICGPGEQSWHFEVHVPTGTDETELREVLKPVVPAFDTYDVVFI